MSFLKLVVAVSLILFVMVLAYTMIKRLPVAEVAMFLNFGPILTVFFAGCFSASEAAKCSDTIKVIIAFAGVIMIVLGKKFAIQQ